MKILLAIIGGIILLVIVFSLLKPACQFIGIFEVMNQAQRYDRGDTLEADSIAVYDLASKKQGHIRFRGVTLLGFWAARCETCFREFRYMEKLRQDYPGLQVKLLSFDDTTSLYHALEMQQVKLPAYFISDTLLFEKPRLLPRTTLLHNKIVVHDRYVVHDWNDPAMRKMIDSLLLIN